MMINHDNQSILKETLNFLHVSELRVICSKLSILDKGNKKYLITRILHFIKTGEILIEPKVPKISCAKRGIIDPLHPNTLMLKGSYKNDLRNRQFLKSLIGKHFHFTATGIDWLNERWIQGNPPTYQEFADIWQSQYIKHKDNPNSPKEEWAYINFTQDFLSKNPKSSLEDIIKNWKIYREKQRSIVYSIIFNKLYL